MGIVFCELHAWVCRAVRLSLSVRHAKWFDLLPSEVEIVHILCAGMLACCASLALQQNADFCRAMLFKRGLSRHAVSVCLSVTFVDSVKKNKHIFKCFSPSGSHSSFSIPNGMAIFRRKGDIHILRHHRGGRGVASLMTTDDKGEGGIDRTDDVIKTVIL